MHDMFGHRGWPVARPNGGNAGHSVPFRHTFQTIPTPLSVGYRESTRRAGGRPVAIFDRLLRSSKERTLEDIRREQEAIRRKQLEDAQRREDELKATQARERAKAEEKQRRSQEEVDRVRELLASSPLPEVARALGWHPKIYTLGDPPSCRCFLRAEVYIDHKGLFIPDRPVTVYADWHVEVNADGSGVIHARGGWEKRLHLRGMTFARAERLILEAKRHIKEETSAKRPHGAPYGVTRH